MIQDLFGFSDVQQVEKDERYTDKVGVPIYTPSERCPFVGELFDKTKYESLIRQINASNVSEQEKSFLRFAATRHIVFKYSKIADYYAHAGEEMQRLMERSALVIIDFDKAIEYGYVKLSKNIEQIQRTTGRWASDEYSNQWRNTKNQDGKEEP
jgi:hypothetical protein